MELVFDIEADGLELDDVNNVWCAVALDITTGVIYEFDPDSISNAINLLASAKRLIGHNIIWYDLPVLNKLFGFEYHGEVIDTLVLSRLSSPDRQKPFNYVGSSGPHSIEVWGHRLGGQQKVEHEDWSKFTPEMLVRCRTDVLINAEVYKALYRELSQ